MSERYRTIVADPPWALEWNARIGTGRSGKPGLPYDTMTVEEICAMDVRSLAASQAHLYLWTTHGFLWDAPRVALSWGFQPTYTLVWAKPGLGVGGRFRHTCEYLLFCERGGALPITRRDLPTHFTWPRGQHSEKPDAFYDLVERVSPGPYAELFARRARFGWDYPIGDQALGGRAFEPAARSPGRPLDGGESGSSGRREIPTVSPSTLNSDTLADGPVAGSDEDRGEDAA